MISFFQSHAGAFTDEHTLQPTLEELRQNTQLLIKLRWAAGVSIIMITGFARFILHIDLNTLPLFLIGVAVLSYNGLLFFANSGRSESLARAKQLAWGQILLDWLMTIMLVHLTGGITSPALMYFVIHAALSGAVLSPWQTRGLVLSVIVIVGSLAWLEHIGAVPHIVVHDFAMGQALYQNSTYIAAMMFFFGSTVFTLSELMTQNSQRLRYQTQHIQELYEARETFVRVATHELRAPLGASLSLMRNIEQGYAGDVSEQQAQILSRVGSRLEGLRILIDDLLDLTASCEASTIHATLQPESVRTALEKIVDRETPFADQKQIQLECVLDDYPGIVLADDFGLGIIFGNLVNNAIKYTPEGGNVRVEYRLVQPEQVIRVRVSDTGIGIPADELPRIYSEFFRASNAKRSSIIGTGIGLAAVHTLVERYRGSIELASEEMKGTTFTVSLPLVLQSAS
jgi:signal transduction histidine kinase